MPTYTFHKKERLKSHKELTRLFKEGHSFTSYPLRIVWIEMEYRRSKFPCQFALSVPKRAFPKAAHRNRIRRKIREAYRLNKHTLYQKIEGNEKQYALIFIYMAKDTLPYTIIEKAVGKMIKRWAPN